jgi:hypothetical protein
MAEMQETRDEQMELELLQRLLSERFGDSVESETSVPLALNSPAPTIIEPSPYASAFPLFAPRLRPVVSATSKGSSDVTSTVEANNKKTKKRKRADETDIGLPLVRLVSPEPVYEGPGRGRILYVDCTRALQAQLTGNFIACDFQGRGRRRRDGHRCAQG